MVIGATEYVIQGRSVPFQTTDVVPLNYRVTTAGNYSFALDHVDGLFTGGAQAIYVKDNLSGTTNTLPYSFSTLAGTFANRFELVYETALSNQIPTFTEANVIVYNQNNEVFINSSNVIMKTVKIFDIRGRLLQEKTNINATEARLNLDTTNQVLVVQITSDQNEVVVKKIIN